MNYKAKVNLAQLDGAVETTVKVKGKEVAVLAIPASKFYIGAKGIYLDTIAFDIKTRGKGGATHLISKSVSKDDRKAGSEG